MKPICVQCQRFYRPIKTGFYFTECMPTHDKAVPGNSHPEEWRPYKVWSGDLWKCNGCGHKIISGVGANPLAVHHEPGFAVVRGRHRAHQFEVNDC